MLTPAETITFVIGDIMCVLGVCSFVIGMTGRAKSDGVLSNKVDSALQGIEEIKQTLAEQRNWREDIGILVEGHSQKIETLFKRVSTLEKEVLYKHNEHDE